MKDLAFLKFVSQKKADIKSIDILFYFTCRFLKTVQIDGDKLDVSDIPLTQTLFQHLDINKVTSINKHIDQALEGIKTIRDLGYLDRLGYSKDIDWFFSQSLKKHRKKTTGKGLYTVQNCIEDMVTQLNSKQKNGKPKDLPLSIVNRWNKAFAECEQRTIEMKKGTRPANNYRNLFSFYDR